MTKAECKRILENLPAIQAFVEGKPIEVSTRSGGDRWGPVRVDDPMFTSESVNFRPKPEPRRWWAHGSASSLSFILMPDERCYHSCAKDCKPFPVQELEP